MGVKKIGRLSLALVVGGLVACDERTGEVFSDASQHDFGTEDVGSASTLVGPAGGTFLFHGGKVKLEVPPGALAKDTSIKALIPKSYPLASRLVSGTVYDLLPDGTTFNKPVKLSISYAQGDVPPTTAEMDLRIHKVVSGAWALVPGGGLDTAANVAWTQINGFSKYGIKGPSPTTQDSKTDISVDAAVPPDLPKPDLPKPPDMPNPPDLPLPLDASKPDLPKPDMPNPPDLPLPPDLPKPPDMPMPQDMPLPPDLPVPDMLVPDTYAPPTCVISGKSYSKGAIHPGGCAECDPAKSTTSWTVKGSTHCLISNVCQKSGAKAPGGCGVCTPSKSKTSWSTISCQPKHVWSKGFAGSGSKYPAGMAVDGSGNTYITGAFSSSINFGGSTPGKKNDSDVFLASFTPGGKHRWSKAFGGLGSDVGSDVAVDGNGNVYLTGNFFTSINFGGSTLKNYGYKDVFVASFTTGGQHRWSKSFSCNTIGTTSQPRIAADVTGNTYLTGDFTSKINLGGSTLSSTKSGTDDVFLASFTPSGKHRWSKSFGDAGYDTDPSVAVDGSGNPYITGSFGGSIHFGGSTLSAKGQSDVFLASFTPSGIHRWSKNFGGTSLDYGSAVAVDSKANVFITGTFATSTDLGGGKLLSNGSDDVFVASYTSTGTYRWSRAFGSSSLDQVYGIDADTLGNVYLTGSYTKSINFGGGTLTSIGGQEMYVVSYSPTGVHRWSRSHGSTGFEQGADIVTDGSGNIHVLGGFQKTVDFGGGPMTATGYGDIVLFKLSP